VDGVVSPRKTPGQRLRRLYALYRMDVLVIRDVTVAHTFYAMTTMTTMTKAVFMRILENHSP
jgi:hypothetical protein